VTTLDPTDPRTSTTAPADTCEESDMTPDVLRNLAANVLAGIVFTLLGIVLFIGAFMLFDKLTPGSLWKELIEDQNTALGVLMGCVAIALAIVIAAAIH